MRIVSLGSRGAILDLIWFPKYRGTKLVIQASEIEGNDDISLMQTLRLFQLLGGLKIEIILENEGIIVS